MLQASRRALTTHAIFQARHSRPAHLRHTFSRTATPKTTISLNPPELSPDGHAPIAHSDHPSTSKRDNYAATARQQKYDDLLDSLNREEANPNRVWGYYCDLLDFTRDGNLPLEIHQRVLRKCTPDAQEIRAAFVRRLRERNVMQNPHRHEPRFLRIISNIRRAGLLPALEDYEFILEQFAAVGHHIGATRVLQEVAKLGLRPRTKTFTLCLQTIAYRLTLPRPKIQEQELKEHCARLCLHIIQVIRKRTKGSVPSACLDLSLRIMKDTGNAKTFMSLMKFAYGIDLDYLDRHLLVSDGGLENPEPFSTAALTTLIDFLGRQEQVSKMISAFEVLSAPLKIGPSDIQLRNFDDEEDDNYFVPDDSSNPRPLPSAQPNITTLNTLIRHCSQSHETTLAKHYVQQAIQLDYTSSKALRSDIQTLPLASVGIPKVLVNADTFRPILGLINRNFDIGLLRWLLPHFRKTRRRKLQDLQYCSTALGQMAGDEVQREDESLGETSAGFAEESLNPVSPPDTITKATTFFTPSSPPSPLHPTPALTDESVQRTSLDSHLESSSSRSANNPKLFDLSLHVSILGRDVQAMRKLDRRIGAALARLSIRRKEALGRRIWAGKNVFVRDSKKRTTVSREDWMDMVNFGGRRECTSSRESEVQRESTVST
ncbi:uncharacterized protein FOMMEDRAFT_21511 [Fomitiporia mediterranea MF3/22]|uniref:uncharacterized protein n=1 Tax=Fomitiporia mediterranea (strain MF3/22) TaxID=694068 RepID=UPI0004409C9A|nr:uncharacterized protein FOMMEDRAFT_21511 [Fomitiporia mediterranea MF3/22]EJD01057.1 hypothetical protein FOMMEDRAFT_21511 [Fomitiporia mediterranea MF3/22]